MKTYDEAKTDYEIQLDVVMFSMDVVKHQRELLIQLEANLKREQEKAKVLEEGVSILAKKKAGITPTYNN